MLCIICMGEESTGISCQGHSPHFVCTACLNQHVSVQSEESDIARLSYRAGQILCPLCPGSEADKRTASHLTCRSEPYQERSLRKLLSKETNLLYSKAIARVQEQKAYEKSLENSLTTRSWSSWIFNLPAVILDFSQGRKRYDQTKKQANAALVAALRRSIPDARQCQKCQFGPVDLYGCSNLRTHHRQKQNGHLDAKGNQVVIDNSCPQCGWFAENRGDWPEWNGELSPASASFDTACAETGQNPSLCLYVLIDQFLSLRVKCHLTLTRVQVRGKQWLTEMLRFVASDEFTKGVIIGLFIVFLFVLWDFGADYWSFVVAFYRITKAFLVNSYFCTVQLLYLATRMFWKTYSVCACLYQVTGQLLLFICRLVLAMSSTLTFCLSSTLEVVPIRYVVVALALGCYRLRTPLLAVLHTIHSALQRLKSGASNIVLAATEFTTKSNFSASYPTTTKYLSILGSEIIKTFVLGFTVCLVLCPLYLFS